MDRYTHADGRTAHAFELTLGSRTVALPRDAADAIRVSVEEACEGLGFESRTEKMGRRISRPRPWPRFY